MEEALQLIRPIAAQRGIAVTAELEAARSLHVLADRHRLIQVLLNLLANAVKYNREAGSVRFETKVVDGRLHFEVEDTGNGIPAHKLERLFTPFERLGAEQTSIEGTGIGLALAKSLVEAMGGSVGVRSAIGRGSCFWIDLPVADTTPCETAETREAARGGAMEGGGAHVPTVLYVEDNLSNFRLVERILSHRPGVRLMTAVQGGLGLELAAQHRPDLILLDLQLPDLPGEEVLRRLREDPRTKDIPVIMVSADVTAANIDRLRGAGARDYLTKPLDVKRFLEVLDEHLGGGA
jgi:CheY-like chemotaxis protein/anti-sigma regulatory factor (Ser/Thr protein kinase)